MKINTQELVNDFLIEAVKRSLPEAKSKVSILVKSMSYEDLRRFADERPLLAFTCCFETHAGLAAAVVHAFHALIADEDAWASAGDEEMWHLCEELLIWFRIGLAPATEPCAPGQWTAASSGVIGIGSTPREAVLRWLALYVFGPKYELPAKVV